MNEFVTFLRGNDSGVFDELAFGLCAGISVFFGHLGFRAMTSF